MKKKVLFAIESMGGGGAEKVLLNIVNNLDREKFEVTLQLLLNEGVYIKDVREDVKVKYIFGDKDRFTGVAKLLYKGMRYAVVQAFKYFPGLLKLFIQEKNEYDVGISFCEGLNSALITCRRTKFKRIISWIHIDFRQHKANVSNKFVEREILKYDHIVCVSYGVLDGIKEVFSKVDPQKLSVIYNPIDFNSIYTTAKDTTSIEKTSKPLVISVGRLSKQKRFDRVLLVAKRLKEEGYFTQFIILGDGPLKKELLQLHHKLDLGDYVKFLGFMKNATAWIDASDIVLMTSDYEGLPVVISEAMVLEKAIVSTNVTGPKELLERGKYGLLVEPNVFDIYLAVKRMLDDPNLRASFSAKLNANKEKFIFKNSIIEIENFINN